MNKPLEGDYFKDVLHPKCFFTNCCHSICKLYVNDFGEVYEKCSLNPGSLSFVVDVLEKSDFINVSLIETAEKKLDTEAFYAKYTTDFKSYLLAGGTTIMPAARYEDMYIGKDDGPSQQSGI